MTVTPDSLRADLAKIAGDKAQTERDNGRIADAGEARREEINARLRELRPTVMRDTAAADEYQALTAERGRLDTMVGA